MNEIENCRRYKLYYAKQNDKITKHIKKWALQEGNEMNNQTGLDNEYVINYLNDM